MRRKDRQMNKEFGYDLIDRSAYGVLSMVDENNGPYAIPLSLAREGEFLYFHSAKDGRKVHIFENISDVWVNFVGETRIPENFTKKELEEMSKDDGNYPIFLSKVFTTEYESAMVRGQLDLVESLEGKSRALKLICEKYTPDLMAYVDKAIKSGMDRVNIYRIRIIDLTCKRKKYDSRGEEMKWGRME